MTVDEKEVRLPDLPKVENKWRPIPKLSSQIPWGYKISDIDPGILEPIPEELVLLEIAKEHLKNYSYRVVAVWLSEASGRHISHMGLKRRLEYERKLKYRANGYHTLAKRLQKTLKALRKIEEESIGCTVEPSRARNFEEYDDSPSKSKTGTG